MNEKINIEQLLHEIIYSNNLSSTIRDIRAELELKKGNQIDNRDLQFYQDRFGKTLDKYVEMTRDIKKLEANFNRETRYYVLLDAFNAQLSNCMLCHNTKILHDIYTESANYRDSRRKTADKIQKLIVNNRGLTFQVRKRKIGYHEVPLQDLLKQYGYDMGETISFELQNQTEKSLKNYLSQLGINIEKMQEADRIEKIILNQNLKKHNNMPIEPEIIYPLEVGNITSENIFSDVHQRLKKIQYLHQEKKLSINEEQYNNIVTGYIRLIEIYQDIQLIIATQEAFKNTIANNYFESLNQVIENAHKEIVKTYDKLNSFINKIDKDNVLGQVVDKLVNSIDNATQTIQDVKQDIANTHLNSKKEQTQVIEPTSYSEKNDEIATLDNFRQQIIKIDQNEELKQRKTALTIEYMKFRNLKFGQANIPFVQYLKIYYPDEIELIKVEEIREQQIQYVYQLWQKSGRHMNFKDYSERVQGVHVNFPEDYVKKDDTINYDSYNNTEISYVETKKKNIDEARERYNKKSALWKVFNRKMNPVNLNFDNMTNEQIEELYTGRRR